MMNSGYIGNGMWMKGNCGFFGNRVPVRTIALGAPFGYRGARD
jgi:hypothetical protein